MVFRFREQPSLVDFASLIKDEEIYEVFRTIWESYFLDNIISSYGFELIRISYPDLELIVQKHHHGFTVRVCRKFKVIC